MGTPICNDLNKTLFIFLLKSRSLWRVNYNMATNVIKSCFTTHKIIRVLTLVDTNRATLRAQHAALIMENAQRDGVVR